jgi:hypothetical protein
LQPKGKAVTKKTKGGSRSAAVDTRKALGFQRIEHVSKTSFQDTSMAVIIPSRSPDARALIESDGDEWPWLHHVFQAHMENLVFPMNQRRYKFLVTGAEVGQAYDDQVAGILAHPEVGTVKYILTIEDDTLPPPDGVQKLIEAIEAGPFDGVGGLYFTKGDFNMPMCYGDPGEYARTGHLDFRPRDIVSALQHGQIMECNGIAMGFSLFRTQSFRDIPRPWFQTLNKWGEGAMTQDLFWCAKARRAGKRFAVDMRVSCAHADWKTNTYY